MAAVTASSAGTTHRRCGPSKDATRRVGFGVARIDAFFVGLEQTH
jgi:hypothetical protein